jgi:hypothetical protein
VDSLTLIESTVELTTISPMVTSGAVESSPSLPPPEEQAATNNRIKAIAKNDLAGFRRVFI